MIGYSIDPLLPIRELEHPVSGLVRDYLARGTEWTVDDWFKQRAEAYYQDQDTGVDGKFSLDHLSYTLDAEAPRKVRFISIRPYYFRGFRQLQRPINLDADLVTVEGRNSSGKTSLAEAIEWLLSGRIRRREQGDPKELAKFVANRFRHPGQKTWVECVLAVDDVTTKVRRELVDDYGTSRKSLCTTRLFIDGVEVEDSTKVLDEYFSGVAPLLMQHTLREFVLDPPAKRPQYFEKLLNIDRISDLIEDAQVSKLRQSDIPRPHGGKTLGHWREFHQSVGEAYFRPLAHYSKLDRDVLGDVLCNDLLRVAVDEFDAKCESNLESCITEMTSLQERELKRRFPLLQEFRPKQNLSETTFMNFSDDSQNDRLRRLEKVRTNYLSFLKSEKIIEAANIAIANALAELRKEGLISEEDQQTCPLCEYRSVPTLTKYRIADIDSWNPERERAEQAKEEFEKVIAECRNTIEDLRSLRRNLLPSSLPEHSVTDIGEIANSDSFAALLEAHTDAEHKLQAFDDNTSLALAELKKFDPELNIPDILRDAYLLIPTLELCAAEYARKYEKFQGYLKELATGDAEYKARNSWLNIACNRDELIFDIQWETAKDRSRKELAVCRELLIEARQKYLELRREAFNQGITDIWSKLRRDDYSAFSKLHIPEPKGKGQKARFEVKAELTSNGKPQEVHALSVLSESQINAIGIATFVTRSSILGHNVLVFDDPVQSMDVDHFKSFAREVLSHLCDYGFQVIVLTHNDDFAQDVNYAHSDRNSRISMEIQHTRSSGISVNEGNRSVLGLVSMGLAYWERGEYDTAWVRLRVAIERQYMLIRMTRGPQPFEWRKWKDFTAKRMWDEFVKRFLISRFPDIARRMPEIVYMTARGAHTGQAPGHTDYLFAVDVIRDLQCQVEVGD